jgi:hypothetical protein
MVHDGTSRHLYFAKKKTHPKPICHIILADKTTASLDSEKTEVRSCLWKLRGECTWIFKERLSPDISYNL